MDSMLLSDEELANELDTFYNFVRICGQSYLNDEGNIRFNHLRGESLRRYEERERVKDVQNV